MTRLTTLTDFINTQLERFDIPDTEKNQNKLRIKFTRTLKKLGYWETAEKKIIGRNETRLFTEKELEQLANEIEPYLLKQGNIDADEIEEYRKNANDYIEQVHSLIDEGYEQQLSNKQYEFPKVTKKEAIEVMITALYEKFFEPLDIQKWNQDKATIHFAELPDTADTDYILASIRLNEPTKHYVKPKK